MLKHLIIFILLLFEFQNVSFGKREPTKTVLMIFEDFPSIPAYKPIIDGVRQKLHSAFGESYKLHMEFLGIEKLTDEYYHKEKFILLNEKYRNLKVDLLICHGSKTLRTLKDHAESHLTKLPTISYALDYSNYGYPIDLRLNEKTVCIGLKFNIEKTIQDALDLFPSTSSIFFISGVSAFDKRMLEISINAANTIRSKRKIEVMTDISMDEILAEVHKISDNSLIIIPVFITDNKLVPYYNPEAINLISREANVPVIILSDMGMGEGAFGGYVLSFNKAGLFIGETAIEILNGINPNSIQVSEDDFYEFIYDYRELKRWNLENSDLIPAKSTILYKPEDPIDKFKWIIGSVLLFLVLQSLLIANLIRLNKSQKSLTKKIIETENKYREFLHEDRGLRLGQITAALSHELNQPLTAILSTAQAGINFINSNEATNDLLKQILQKIVDNDKRTASVLNSLRGMLKLENREKEKVNLNQLIEEVVSVINSEAIKRDIKLFTELMEEQVNVFADKVQLQQVLLNIIFNAIQSVDKVQNNRGIVTITCLKKNEHVIVSVVDNGIGIKEEIKERLFKPFASSKPEGMGIGLSICKTIIDDHKGLIWADNVAGGGAKFSFSLNVLNDDQRQQ